jgi:hypothetical protein
MTGKTTVTLERLGNELYHIVLNASEHSKARILQSVTNSALMMERDAKQFYYAASGLNVITGLLHGGYRGFSDAHAVGNDTYIRVGIRNDEALSKGFNYAVLHEFGGKFHKARNVATNAVRHQGTILVNKLLREVGF